jgi:acetyl esterase/lipase
VFLAAGGEDKRAPIEHSRMMERALRAAGVPVETLYYDTEGTGSTSRRTSASTTPVYRRSWRAVWADQWPTLALAAKANWPSDMQATLCND